MNVQQSPARTLEHLSAHNGSEKRLQGTWLVLARVAWVAVTLLVLGLSIGALPRYAAVLQTVCAAPAQCFSDQLTTVERQGLHAFGMTVGAYATLIILLQGLEALICLALGTLLFWRRSHEPVALLCAWMLVTFFSITTALHEGLAPLSLGWYAVVESLDFLGQLSFGLFFYLFPTGRFVPRWTRWSALLYAGYYLWTIITFHPGRFISLLDALVFFGLILTFVVAQVYRYRRVSTPKQRQQTKWVMLALVLAIVGFILLLSSAQLLFPAGRPSSVIANLIGSAILNALFLLIPCSIVIAVLRSRLWDIDVIINKALVYGGLSALLAVIYIGLVLGLQALLGGVLHQTNAIALVISTLAIAALFQPLRHHIQAIIDRRFYRRKYDAARTLAAFSATLHQEVDLATLSEHLVAVVEETMQPTSVSLWLRPPAPLGAQQAPWSTTLAGSSEKDASKEGR